MARSTSDVHEALALARKRFLYEQLESARRHICVYNRDPCDCKYGRISISSPSGEQTGCPELRDLIHRLTGWQPFNHGQDIEDDMRGHEAREVAGREGEHGED